jgi:hypothetical protein
MAMLMISLPMHKKAAWIGRLSNFKM